MVKIGPEAIGKATGYILEGPALIEAKKKFDEADEENKQEAFDDMVKLFGSIFLPLEGQLFMTAVERGTDAIANFYESGKAKEVYDTAKTAVCGLYKCIKKKF